MTPGRRGEVGREGEGDRDAVCQLNGGTKVITLNDKKKTQATTIKKIHIKTVAGTYLVRAAGPSHLEKEKTKLVITENNQSKQHRANYHAGTLEAPCCI